MKKPRYLKRKRKGCKPVVFFGDPDFKVEPTDVANVSWMNGVYDNRFLSRTTPSFNVGFEYNPESGLIEKIM